MMPRLSPNKTWEGYVGGIVTGVVSGMLVMGLSGLGWVHGAVLGVLLSAITPVGDLGVSMIKRQQKAIGQLEMAKKQVEQYQGAISAEGEINKIWGNTVNLWPKKKKSGGVHEI